VCQILTKNGRYTVVDIDDIVSAFDLGVTVPNTLYPHNYYDCFILFTAVD